jgi:rubredoxin
MKNSETCPECENYKLEIIKIDKELEETIDWCKGILCGQIKETKTVHYIIYKCKNCGFIFRKEIETY